VIGFKELDKPLIFAVVALFAIGLLCLYSASYGKEFELTKNFVFKQCIWIFVSFLIILPILVLVDYQRLIDLSYFLYAIGLLLLLIVLFSGATRLGAQRWFGVGGVTFQPSEFNKIIYILMLTSYLGHTRDQLKSIKGLIVPILLTIPPFALILLQPDLGTALVLIPVFFSMLFIAGARIQHLIGMALCGVVSLPFFWTFLKDYQKDRLLVFLDPGRDPLGAGYTVIQSKIAIGSGGLFGKGWLSGTQNILNFLPERHSDFIFSVVGEEWGFVGAMVVIAFYFLLLKRGLAIVEATTDAYGRILGTGIIAMLAFQIFVNIAMTIGFMPVVGLPLPLLSYGGSSFMTSIVAIGLLLNVGIRKTRF